MNGFSLLLEIGTEELPASYVAGALDALPVIVGKLLEQSRLSFGAMSALGTPRRIALIVEAVAERQTDLAAEVLGPPASVAFDADGTPSRAGAGFARKNGKEPSDLRRVDTPKGAYAAVFVEEHGRPASDVLPELLSTAIGAIPFRKSMRWGAGEYAFGRPIQWLIALHGDRVIPTRFADVAAGRSTRGHRFLAPTAVDIGSAGDYVATLRRSHVLVDPAERRASMHEALRAAASRIGAVLVEDEFLMGECLSLVEEPHVVVGSFDPGFLTLPDEVVVAVMRGHQRYFAARSTDGRLLPRYLTVVNTAKDPATITIGNDRVLSARLADARFFVNEDRKAPLADRVSKLDAIVYQAKLGTIGDKVRRVTALQAHMFTTLSVEQSALAARLSKADLTTLIVGEFPELQGMMGRWYAVADGVAVETADAIRDHYLPRAGGDAVPATALSAALAVADRIDTLVGCFGIGLVPTGSADPYALRRAALGVIRIALEGPLDVSLTSAVAQSHALYPVGVLADAAGVRMELVTFFRARLRAHYSERHRADTVEACLAAWPSESLRDLDARVSALTMLRARPEFESLAIAFKRTFNIAKDTTGDADSSLWQEAAERELATVFASVRGDLDVLIRQGAYEEALLMIARVLRGPIDAFFEKVFVMVDDLEVRENRLRLLAAIARTVTQIAHFHLLATTDNSP
jgi:glycyl-tRNA synthetase beta chain